jgi:hypothetical protein
MTSKELSIYVRIPAYKDFDFENHVKHELGFYFKPKEDANFRSLDFESEYCSVSINRFSFEENERDTWDKVFEKELKVMFELFSDKQFVEDAFSFDTCHKFHFGIFDENTEEETKMTKFVGQYFIITNIPDYLMKISEEVEQFNIFRNFWYSDECEGIIFFKEITVDSLKKLFIMLKKVTNLSNEFSKKMFEVEQKMFDDMNIKQKMLSYLSEHK